MLSKGGVGGGRRVKGEEHAQGIRPRDILGTVLRTGFQMADTKTCVRQN